ncbi:hypothetical protein F2Q68_00042358 [Brassica cretica]|uniref:Uncharacterized protein n=1 Tax=Brassica cretica TaxID=69181 RepID=A0A8S9MGU3_BRACR|nr:hypothetical protein F2Q68_00042358 [Brassica cretica]
MAAKKTLFRGDSFEMVLADAWDNKIHATCKRTLMYRVQRDLPTGEWRDEIMEKEEAEVALFNHLSVQNDLIRDLERFIPTDVKVHMMYANQYSDFDQDRSDVFNVDLCKHLKSGYVAARITVYPSYNLLKRKEIYYPTNEEVHGLVPNGHIVLLTHYGFDAEDRLFYQFQESYGVETCDKGYAYVYGDLVTHFVDMVL